MILAKKLVRHHYRTQNWNYGHYSSEVKIRQNSDTEDIPCLLSKGAARVGASPPNGTEKAACPGGILQVKQWNFKGARATLIPAMVKLEGS